MNRKYWIVSGILVVLVGGWFGYRTLTGNRTNRTSYKVQPAVKETLRKTVSATGTIQPWSTVDIKSKAGGKVLALNVDVGDHVSKGQVIAKIDSSDSLLTFSQAQADTDSAKAKQAQSRETYRLTQKQSVITIQQAQAQAESSRANVQVARARLESARHSATSQPTQTESTVQAALQTYQSAVQQRLQLNSTQAQDRAAAESALNQATANYKNAALTLERDQQLVEKGYIAKSSVDAAQASADVAKAEMQSAKAKVDTLSAQQEAVLRASDANVRQAEAQYQGAKASPDVQTRRDAVSEAQASLSQAQAQYDTSLAQLAAAKADTANNAIRSLDITSARASTARAQAALQNAQTTLTQTTVRADSEGVVLQKYVEQGTIITSGLATTTTGTSIVQLGNTDRLYVDVAVDETDIASIKEGQKVNVTVDAFPDDHLNGRVAKINPQAVVEQNVTTIHVRVEIENDTARFKELKPTMNATCDFIVREKADAVVVPASAVHTEGAEQYVEVVDAADVKQASTTSGTPSGPPADFDPSNLPKDFDPSKMPKDFDPSKMPKDFDPSKMPGPIGAGGSNSGNSPTITVTGVKVERRAVQIGFESSDGIEITSGLKPGEFVVVSTILAKQTSPSEPRAAMGGGMGPR